MVIDQFERIGELVTSLTEDLQAAVGTWRPDPDANSIDWLVWHLSRAQDEQTAHLAGVEPAWTAKGWHQRFGLPFAVGAHGYGHTSGEVGQVQASADLLAGYHRDVHALSLDYARTLTADELARVVDPNWDPPVTASVRLVSLIGDCLQHAGQAAYVRGMATRAGIG